MTKRTQVGQLNSHSPGSPFASAWAQRTSPGESTMEPHHGHSTRTVLPASISRLPSRNYLLSGQRDIAFAASGTWSNATLCLRCCGPTRISADTAFPNARGPPIHSGRLVPGGPRAPRAGTGHRGPGAPAARPARRRRRSGADRRGRSRLRPGPPTQGVRAPARRRPPAHLPELGQRGGGRPGGLVPAHPGVSGVTAPKWPNNGSTNAR